MTELPDHVRHAVTPKARASRKGTSPYRPRSSFYRTVKWEWVALYGPLVAWVSLVALSGQDTETLLMAAYAGVGVVAAALYRVPQEVARSRARRWVRDDAANAWRWEDPSGEWDYARPQVRRPATAARWLVAAAMPALWWWTFAISGATGSVWVYAALPVGVAALLYTHRHLPTSLQPARAVRWCGTCGRQRPAEAVPLCPRCSRIAEVVHFPAVPSLRRRLRDL